jgi:hypothetical protein
MPFWKNKKTLWMLCITYCVFVFATLCFLWYQQNTHYHPNHTQLTNLQQVEDYLAAKWGPAHSLMPDSPIYVPTGIFIQSIFFKNSNTVNVTGFIWQKYTDGVHDNITHDFIFPEAIDALSSQKNLMYQQRENNTIVYGWYFEADLLQNFNYQRFPLDHKTIWLRLWAKDFNKNVVLIPDFAAYTSTQPTDTFGIDNHVVLNEYTIQESFFNYQLTDYDTNFGISDYIGQQGFPELHFNIVLQRNLTSTLITDILPLTIATILLFCLILLSTKKQSYIEKFWFKVTSIISTCVMLCFVILLLHINLRDSINISGVIYIEYFYILFYLALAYVVINTLVIVSKTQKYVFFDYEDGLPAKILYWPLLLTAALIITLFIF